MYDPYPIAACDVEGTSTSKLQLQTEIHFHVPHATSLWALCRKNDCYGGHIQIAN